MNNGEFIFAFIVVLAVMILFVLQLKKRVSYRRSLNQVFLRVIVARKDSESDEKKDTIKDFREQISIMEQFFAGLKSLYSSTFMAWIFGQEYISFEYVAHKDEIYFYVVVPKRSQLLVEKQIIALYPDCLIEKTNEVNIFKDRAYSRGEIMRLAKTEEYPIRTYQKLESDSINALLSALGRLDSQSSAVIQILLRPVPDTWQKKIKKMIRKTEKGKPKKRYFSLNPLVWIRGFIDIMLRSPDDTVKEEPQEIKEDEDPIDDEGLMKEKVKKTGYETVIRIITTSNDENTAEVELKNIISAFSQFASPAYNKFKPIKWKSLSLVVHYYIFRQFAWWQPVNIFNIEELATIFHFPHSKYNRQPEIKWQHFKIVKAPSNTPTEGLYIGDNVFRDERKKIFLKNEDRFRHFYVIGQTGTGKSSILSVMARQDLQNHRGLAVIDPHGDFAEGLLDFIPKDRADDLVFFDPGDLSRPMGLNILEAETDDEKAHTVKEATNIMIKLFGPEIFGPRIVDYFENGCFTLMDYPNGGAITDIIKLFTDENFQRERRTTLKNPIVKAWWDHTYAKMGAREKGEIIPYFAAKFGQFITNTMMRNIVGQTKSAFDITDIMNNEQILLISLSKGILGDLNSKLIGLILVSKIQMAAMKRQKMDPKDRKDFFLYIDEFQNYVTDSIESILSEARKYRLGLIIAHQYIGQLQKSDALTKTDLNLKDAIFGNVGSIMSYKIGPEDADLMTKQFAPVYSEQDFINMDAFQAALKLSVDGKPTTGFSLDVPRPWLTQGDYETGQALKALSRLKYGREREFIEKEIIYRIS
ncbi:hypothetical protein CSB09_01040 [Candidatus Gracilibacteria bacterium]|nr:MAG: hypothetical protein CSB09_01040 [Candidatus Gracilibacteria bacterium]